MTTRDRDGDQVGTERDRGIPRTSSAAIVIAGVIGVLSLTVHAPLAVAGAVLGVLFVVGTTGLTGSYWRIGLGTGVLVCLAAGGIGLIGVGLTGSNPTGGVLALIAMVLGVGIGVLTIDGATPQSVGRGGVAALHGAIAATLWAAPVYALDVTGSAGAIVSELVWLGGTGSPGLGASIALAAVAVGIAAYAIPPAARTRPENLETYRTRRRLLAIGLAVVTVALAGAVLVSQYVPGLPDVGAVLAGTPLVRAPLAVVIAVGIALAGVGMIVRETWAQESKPPNLAVPMLSGALLGVGGFVVVAFGLGVPVGLVLSVLLVAALVLGVAGSVAWAYGVELLSDSNVPAVHASAAIAVAIALSAGGLVTGAGVELEATISPATVLEGVAALALFSTAGFVTNLGAYGRNLGWEIGPAGATPLPQFVRVGWSGALAVVGFVVAALGAIAATLFAPVLSAPAMLAVVLGFGAVVLGSWLLA